jgi:L-serine dehydratase
VVGESCKAIHKILMENHQTLRGVREQEVQAHLNWVLETREARVTQDVREEGLPRLPFELHRRAKRIYERALRANAEEGFLQKISSYAMACSGSNAAGRVAVATPTLGSAGTLPALGGSGSGGRGRARNRDGPVSTFQGDGQRGLGRDPRRLLMR